MFAGVSIDKFAIYSIAFLLSFVQTLVQAQRPAPSPAPTASAASAASGASAASAADAAQPIASRFRVDKLARNAAGQPDAALPLDSAANATVGDVVQYSASHRNVSGRRLLRVEFAIPVPCGTEYVAGSALPVQGKFQTGQMGQTGQTGQMGQMGLAGKIGQLDQVAQSGQAAQVVWLFDRLEPLQTVKIQLQVRITPDDTLTPLPAAKPKPAIRPGGTAKNPP